MAWNLVDSREESNPCKNKTFKAHVFIARFTKLSILSQTEPKDKEDRK